MMYGLNTFWKLELNSSNGVMFYTCRVIEEDDSHIKVKTIRDETRILQKEEILQSLQIDESVFIKLGGAI